MKVKKGNFKNIIRLDERQVEKLKRGVKKMHNRFKREFEKGGNDTCELKI